MATVATGVVRQVTAAVVWLRSQLRDGRNGAEIQTRNWLGYIIPNGIYDWYVRGGEDHETFTATELLDVID